MKTDTTNHILNTVKEIDGTVLTTINFDGSDVYDMFWMLYTNRYTWIPLAIVVAYYLLSRGGWRNMLLLGVSVIIMFLLSDYLVASIIKPLVARLRPSHDTSIMDMLSYVNDYRGGRFGFPSNHASNGFAAATLLTLLLRKRIVTVTAFLWAIGSCYSRLYLGVHFPTDILTGAVLGVLFALLVYGFYKRSYLYLSQFCPMKPFDSLYRGGGNPWAVVITFWATVAVLAAATFILY